MAISKVLLCSAAMLVLLATVVSTYELRPRYNRNPPPPPPSHHPSRYRKPTNRVIMVHPPSRPYKQQQYYMGPIAFSSKPSPVVKYPPPPRVYRPYSMGPPKYVTKKPYMYGRNPGPGFPPMKNHPYLGMPQGPSTTFNNGQKRPYPLNNKPYSSDTGKETIATFVNKPSYNNKGTPILTYNGSKNPVVSYGPPYPPKPFSSLGVTASDTNEEVIQGSHPSTSVKYPGSPSKYPGSANKYQGSSASVKYPGLTVSSSISYPGPSLSYPGSSESHPITTVNYPGSVNYPSTSGSGSQTGSSVQYPSSSSSNKRRRPQRQEGSAVHTGSIVNKPKDVQFPSAASTPDNHNNHKPQDVAHSTSNFNNNYDEFLAETFSPDLSGGQHAQPSKSQSTRTQYSSADKTDNSRHRGSSSSGGGTSDAPKSTRTGQRETGGRQTSRRRTPSRNYEVKDEPEEESAYAGWQPSDN